MRCRRCGEIISPDPEVLARIGRGRAARFEDCVWRCRCGVAYSNARDPGGRTMIHARPQDNVPQEVHEGLDEILAGAINETSRGSKRSRFAFETSEDAVTWTVIRGLGQAGQLAALLPPDERPQGAASLLLWGAPVDGPDAARIAEALVAVSDALHERPRRRSEPDVVIAWERVLVVVEAKHRARNDKKPADYPNWRRYLDRDDLFIVPDEAVRATGLYELVRNWRIAAELAERLGTVRTMLVNLGPPTIARSAEAFGKQLAQGPGLRFVHRTWSAVMADADVLPGWLEDYAARRRLIPGRAA